MVLKAVALMVRRLLTRILVVVVVEVIKVEVASVDLIVAVFKGIVKVLYEA